MSEVYTLTVLTENTMRALKGALYERMDATAALLLHSTSESHI